MLPIRLLSNNLVYMGTSQDSEDDLLSKLNIPQLTRQLTADVETISTVDLTALGIGIAISAKEAFYCPILPVQCPELEYFVALLSDNSITKVYHNANFDIGALRLLASREGLPQPDITNVEDTAMMANMSGHRSALEDIGTEYLDIEDLFSIPDLLNDARRREGKKTVNMLNVPWLEAARKCLNDVITTWKSLEYFSPLVSMLPEVLDNYEQDMALWSNLKEMELVGLALDQLILEQHYARLRSTVTRIKTECELEYGFNPGSPGQVGFILASRGHVLPLNKSKRALRSGSELLELIDDPLARTIEDYRGSAKLLSSYVIPWRGLDRAYTHFRLDLSTGRLGSYDRNLQNVPVPMRDVFTPDSGTWTWADMSQVELRCFAYVTKDPLMVEAYEKGYDLHSMTQQELWPGQPEKRQTAKTFNFAMIYYGKIKTLAQRCNISMAEAERGYYKWMNLYKVGAEWMRREYEARPPYVEDIYGRRMRIPTDEDIWKAAQYNEGKFNALLEHVRRTQVNFQIQASAASINKRGMNKLFEWSTPIRLQVHDEYLWDGRVEVSDELHHIHPELVTPFERFEGPKWKKG